MRGESSARAATQAALDRAGRLSDLNAFLEIDGERALQRAGEIDQQISVREPAASSTLSLAGGPPMRRAIPLSLALFSLASLVSLVACGRGGAGLGAGGPLLQRRSAVYGTSG